MMMIIHSHHSISSDHSQSKKREQKIKVRVVSFRRAEPCVHTSDLVIIKLQRKYMTVYVKKQVQLQVPALSDWKKAERHQHHSYLLPIPCLLIWGGCQLIQLLLQLTVTYFIIN
jgi:hypothetical protein